MIKGVLTPEIIVESLKRSSLKTILIEGKDDIKIYRQIEEELDHLNVSVLPCGGKQTLLEVYKRKHEISIPVLFICDSDLWIFVSKPSLIREDIILTEGYSIENELYQDGEQYILNLLSSIEKSNLQSLIKSVCLWFSFEIEKVLMDSSYDCAFSNVTLLNDSIVSKNSYELKDDFLVSRSFITPSKSIYDDILSNYQRKLRGKYLFQAIEKVFQERGKASVKYSRYHLFDIIYRFVTSMNNPNSILNKRKREIESYFKRSEQSS